MIAVVEMAWLYSRPGRGTAPVLACAVWGIPLCTECFPELAASPGWPLRDCDPTAVDALTG